MHDGARPAIVVEPARWQLVPLRRDHVAALSLPETPATAVVRECGLGLLNWPQWCWAATIEQGYGPRVAGIGGIMWLSAHWAGVALAAADWMRPMMWRPFLPLIQAALERAEAEGATRIETTVDPDFAGGHRLVMALGFRFCGLQSWQDGTPTRWCVYARTPASPEGLLGVAAHMAAAHRLILRDADVKVRGT